ncbi:LCP family glycopolymer transferase CpsA [Streptococcus entericus]|uniref:LCP family glycopolymer transferase CpsA n=1 Tax=Streptococcus entericus TaxID=155680 RepID=UPI00035F8BE4|nr:LCP family protein [Streptococcus entericus]
MNKRSQRHRQAKSATGLTNLFNLFLLALYTLASAYLAFLIVTYNFLAFRSVNWIAIGLLFLVFCLGLLLIVTKKAKLFNSVLLLLSSLLVGAGIFFAHSAIDLSKQLNQTASFSQVEMTVIVANDSPLTDISQVTSLLAPANDAANLDKLLANLKAEKSLTPNVDTVDAYQTAYNQIMSDHSKAMALNQAYIPLLEAVDPEFTSKIRTLYGTKIETPAPPKQTVTNGDAFNIYISGIDSYGSISGVSRSDVNIIMTVNRQTKKVLLTTTPRDAYVPIAGGGNGQSDKLTHAGIYGVDSSVQTLENLYGLPIDYYVRLNFTSFVELIDLVGGIEVDNDQEFTSLHGKYHFPMGHITLNAEQALSFVRERYSLQGGDNDRGKNQMKVISALVNKLASLESIGKYQSLIDGLSGSVQTDMPLSTMMDLANGQLDAGGQYQVTSQAVTGYGSTGQLPSYAMPNAALYMVSLDEASVAQAKQAMLDVLEGR